MKRAIWAEKKLMAFSLIVYGRGKRNDRSKNAAVLIQEYLRTSQKRLGDNNPGV